MVKTHKKYKRKMEEIKKVLEMLEKGKISVEEAERLIRVIKEAKEREEKDFGFFGFSSFISDIVGKTIKDAIKFSKASWSRLISTEIPSREDIRISVLGGEISIKSKDIDKIEIEGRGGFFNIYEEEDIKIKGEADIVIPDNKNLILKILGGEVNIKARVKDFSSRLMGGEMNADIEFDKADLYVVGGEINLDTEKKPMILKVKKFGGEINIPYEFEKRGEEYIYGENPQIKISINLMGGEFTLRFKSSFKT